jgi:hypothetical protein
MILSSLRGCQKDVRVPQERAINGRKQGRRKRKINIFSSLNSHFLTSGKNAMLRCGNLKRTALEFSKRNAQFKFIEPIGLIKKQTY